MAYGTAAWDGHEVVDTRVERKAVADGHEEEVSYLVVHLLNAYSSDWSEFVQLF